MDIKASKNIFYFLHLLCDFAIILFVIHKALAKSSLLNEEIIDAFDDCKS